MERVTTAVIGAGHCGLAVSRSLSERSIDHIILERGEVANTWRADRWDSLRLLTPNRLTRLAGCQFDEADPDGYMSVPEVVRFVSSCAVRIAAPVRCHTAVSAVRQVEGGYRLTSSSGELEARCVVLATGAFNQPVVPSLGGGVPSSVQSVTPATYRNPDALPPGGVLVVGASATGVQLAEEIARSGRRVVLAVGEHVRLPRVYRGRDILWWMDATGVWDQRFDEIDDLERARALPSPQLVGTPERRTLDLNVLSELGVELTGRLAMIRDGKALFSGGLKHLFALADLKMNRLLDTFDAWAVDTGRVDEFEPPHRFEPTRAPGSPRLHLDLTRGEIATVLWATGFRPDYSWLHVPVLDPKGRLRHHGGVLEVPGLYAMGLPVLRRRKSTFIDGADADADDLCEHLSAYLSTSSHSIAR
ncbi:MAG: flavin-containing monooxygenase [Vicinamibacterales bacterium]